MHRSPNNSITFQIDPELKERLRKHIASDDRSLSSWIRKMIKAYLDSVETQNPPQD